VAELVGVQRFSGRGAFRGWRGFGDSLTNEVGGFANPGAAASGVDAPDVEGVGRKSVEKKTPEAR
jgi:hypothetical protein